MVYIEQPADRGRVNRRLEAEEQTPYFQDAPVCLQERRDQAVATGAVRLNIIEFERLGAGFAAYAGVIGDGSEVLGEFFAAASFSQASIFSMERGASMTRRRNSVHSSMR